MDLGDLNLFIVFPLFTTGFPGGLLILNKGDALRACVIVFNFSFDHTEIYNN